MKTKLIKTLPVLALVIAAAGTAIAAEPETTLAWQQPGYVQEVVIVRASRTEVLEEVRARAARRLRLALLDKDAGAF